jgi:hypothetical protein
LEFFHEKDKYIEIKFGLLKKLLETSHIFLYSK